MKIPMPSAAFVTTLIAIGLGPTFGCGGDDGTENGEPWIVDAIPTTGTIVPEGRSFTIVVAEPDDGDELYLRFLIDYVPYDSSVSRVVEFSGIKSREPVVFKPDCAEHDIQADVNNHRLNVIVSDRPFVHPTDHGEGAEQAPTDAHVLSLAWEFQITCP